MTELEHFRADKDDFFASHPQSPLTQAQKQPFKGLIILMRIPPCAWK